MLKNKRIGLGITGSFCTLKDMLEILRQLKELEMEIYLFVSEKIFQFDTRFYTIEQLKKEIEKLGNFTIVDSVVDAEPFGPKIPLDIMLVYPCSGNTLSKLTHGINDNAVTMAVKSTLRNNHKVVLGINTNDALSTSGKNIMQMLNTKNYYLVPMYQDDIEKKPFSMIADKEKLIQTVYYAMQGKQIQPVFEGVKSD